MASGTINGTTSNEYITVKISWTSTANASTNTSSVTAIFYAMKSYPSTAGTYGTGTWYLTINGTSKTITEYIELPVDNTWHEIGRNTVSVTHGTNGAKSITISASGGISGTSYSTTTCSGTAVLDTIAPASASTFTLNKTSVQTGGSITVSITRASSSYTHTVYFYMQNNLSYSYIANNVGTSYTYSIPSTWPSGTCVVTLTTYNGSTQVGTTSSKTFTVTSTSTPPTAGTLSASPTTVYDAGYVSFTLTGSSSSVTNYKIYAYSTGTRVYNSATRPSSVSVYVTSSGYYYALVTDSNGLTAESNYVYITVNSTSGGGSDLPDYNYTAASAVVMNAVRDETTPSTIKVTVKGTTQYTNNTSHRVAIGYKKVSETSYTYSGITSGWTAGTPKTATTYNITGTDTNSLYNFRLRVYDSEGTAQYSSVYTMSAGSAQLSLGHNGTSVAIGGIALDNNEFTCFLKANFNNGTTGVVTNDISDFETAVSGIVSDIINSSSSDRNLKNSIDEMSKSQETFFNNLVPVTFKYNDGKSGRTHYGFIAQDVRDALTASSLTTQDFAGYCESVQKDENSGNETINYSLRYQEFIALNTFMIKQLQAENNNLKSRINVLEKQIQQLINTSSKD